MASRIVISLFWILCGFAALAYFLRDAEERELADAFVRKYSVSERRPSHVETIHFAPAADFAFEVAADVALQDTLAPIALAHLDPETRRVWIDSVQLFDSELADAHALVLRAMRDRPGWTYHRALAGELDFVRSERRMDLGRAGDRWLRPLKSAIASTPGEPYFVLFAGEALLRAWTDLDGAARSQAVPILKSALSDPSFVETQYLAVVDAIGRGPAMSLLPDRAAPLRAALSAEASIGEVENVSRLFPRWETAEWRERVESLGAIERLARFEDASGTKQKCREWMSRHGPAEFDTPPGRRQVARLIALWPDEPGSWQSDPRAEIVSFFLDGRLADVDGAALFRATSQMTNVPRPIAARAALAAGDVYSADVVVRNADTGGSFEWTQFYVDKAHFELAHRRREQAEQALAAVAPAAREECAVLIAREAVSRSADAMSPVEYHADSWAGLNLPVCIPFGADASVEIAFDLPGPAVVSYGLDGGRSGTISAPAGLSVVAIPAERRFGRRIVFLRREAGGEPIPLRAAIRERTPHS